MAAKKTSALVVSGDLSPSEIKAQVSKLRKKYGHMAQEDASAASGVGEGIPTISSDNLSFAVRNGDVIGFPRNDRRPGQEIPVVVLAHAFHNAFMPERYVKGKPVTVECSAVAERSENLAPPATWPAEHKGADSCQLCPKNAFGTGKDGQGKACRNSDCLIVLPLHNVDPASFTDKWIEKQPLMRMFVPPTSMRAWAKYAETIVDEKKGAGVPLHAVVTLAVVQPSDKYKQELAFSAASVLDEKTVDALTKRRDEARELALKPPVYQAPKKGPVASKATAGGRKRVAPKRR